MFDLIEESAQWNYLNIIQLKNVIMEVSNCMKNTLVVSVAGGGGHGTPSLMAVWSRYSMN
jgi:hypothetical protein